MDTVQSVLNAHFILSQSWTPIVDLDYIAGANTNEGPDSVVNTTQDFTDQITAHFLNAYLLGTKLASPAFRLYPDDPAYCSELCLLSFPRSHGTKDAQHGHRSLPLLPPRS